jgi:hypothetical protein
MGRYASSQRGGAVEGDAAPNYVEAWGSGRLRRGGSDAHRLAGEHLARRP